MKLQIGAARYFISGLKTVAVTFAASLFFQQAASALTYSTSGAPTQYALGNQLGPLSNFDWLQIDPYSGTIDSSTTSIVLNKLTFTAGYNALLPAVSNGSFTETITIGGTSGSLVVPFTISINYSDMLTIIGGQKLSLQVGASIWNLVVNGLTIGPNFGGSQTSFLTAQLSDPVATPLPAAVLLFGSGLGGMALLRLRRKKVAAA